MNTKTATARHPSRQAIAASALAIAAALALPLAAQADASPAAESAVMSFDITFSGYSGSEALTDFPVLVRLSPALNGFDYSRCRTDGSDIRFIDASGSPLAREIDTWTHGGESLVWVKVPSLTASTKITCLYGFAGAAPGSASDVWSNGYAAVWHLGESALPLADSSADPAPFSVSNCLSAAAFAAAGKLGGAVDFSQTVANDAGKIYSWVSAADTEKLDGFDDFTVEFWTYAVTTASGQQMYMGKRDDSKTGAWWIYQNSGATSAMNLTAAADGASGKSIVTVLPSFDNWNHVAFVRDTTTTKGYSYLAGECTKTNSPVAPMNSASVTNCAGAFYLGNNFATGSNRLQGKIDELRISRVARSADWVGASHDCVENAGFATYTTSAAQTANDWTRYARQFSVTFSGAPSAALQDFPVLVRLSEGSPVGFSYADCRRANGGDLRFADAGGNLLASEVDTWNANGESLVWVKVPSLAAGTRIKAYYGWENAPAVDGSRVWDDDYVGVWHLGESALPLAESTGVSTPFSASNCLTTNAFAATGRLGGAVDFTQTFANAQGKIQQFLTADHDDDLTGFGSFTVEFWTKRSAGGSGNRYVLTKRASSSVTSYEIFQTAAANCGVFQASADGATSAYVIEGKENGMLLGWNDWYHQAYVRDASAGYGYGYVNGNAPFAYQTTFTGTVFDGETPLYLGNRQSGNSSNGYNGLVDEVRISRLARSAAWVKASHDTVAGTSFARYSAARANNDTFVIVVK